MPWSATSPLGGQPILSTYSALGMESIYLQVSPLKARYCRGQPPLSSCASLLIVGGV